MLQEVSRKQFSLAEIITKKTGTRILSVWVITCLFIVFGDSLLGSSMSTTIAVTAFLILLFTIIAAAFGILKEADELAHKLGEPYGTVILTLSIVSIEAIMISAVMLGPGENPTIGKDSIFSVMMIIMNLFVGICILIGGFRFGEREYNTQGTVSYLGMIALLGGVALVLPNFVDPTGSGQFTGIQAVVISILVVILYGFFLFLQMKGYKHIYLQPKRGSMDIPFRQRKLHGNSNNQGNTIDKNSKKEIIIRSLLLIIMVVPIVLLSHNLAVVVDYGLVKTGLPPLLGGLLIAIIVFTPESLTALKAAAKRKEFQRAINLCHGALVSTLGLTVPSVLLIGLLTGKSVLFGMTSIETVLFGITMLLSVMSFLGKRITPIFGIMHLVLFAIFVLLIF